LAEALINQGNAAIVKGNYAVALQLLQKSQTQYNRLLAKNDKDILALKGLARALATMGVVYTQQSNYFMALENYQKALKLYESAKDTQGIAKALNNIGIIYKSKGNYTKALDYLKQAYQLQSEIKEPNAAMTLTNIGVIYFESGKPEQAFPYYNQALKAFAQFPNPIGLALLHNYLGDYHRRTEMPPKPKWLTANHWNCTKTCRINLARRWHYTTSGSSMPRSKNMLRRCRSRNNHSPLPPKSVYSTKLTIRRNS
jgi:tetratricopeptide (TPR) repeat protein